MDIATFQSKFPEETRIEFSPICWKGEDIEFYNASMDNWVSLNDGQEADLFSEKQLTFSIVDGLIKSSLIAGKEYAIIIGKSTIGFVRGKRLKSLYEEEMIDLDLDDNQNSGLIIL